MDLSLFVGVFFGGIGSFAILKTLHKKEVAKLKRYFSNQQETYAEEFQQKVKSHGELISEQQARYIAEIEKLQQQIHQQTAEKENVLTQLEKEKELNHAHQKKLRENNQDIDEILESLEKHQQSLIDSKDVEIQALQAQNKILAINLEQLKVELFTLKQNRIAKTAQNDETGDSSSWTIDQITELLQTLFPDITLLRDSVAVLASQPENLVKLIKAIKDIYDGHPYSPTKVRATDKKWTECRVPHINLMRIYFQKCKKASGYQILISPKKNQKSQDQDYEWLKSHQAC
ncbi:hypothetical protein [[Limnothrix rosea] IAM M-220]|uniref:hypothetical protein n=1 Tax=[Limnothrix rosea] IAM M-220 TaxID=454133 RepID=UPI0009650C94|nr:hypothetical protein [[Limnothrix rosea] IAM M-220]OKH17983.1 hypothetical protein NIES208_07365 [[Limnothrix rosea] IAM M-220]